MILICGATGRVGTALIRELRAAGARLRCLVRDLDRARASLGPEVELACANFDDATGLDAALRGVKQFFVMSPVGPEMAVQQERAAQAAVRAGVERIVKLSGSSWTMQPNHMTSTGAAHAQVEAVIERTSIAHTFIRPNVFMQGMLGRLPGQIAQGDSFGLAIGAARAAFIDINDIAAVAARALLAEQTLGPVLDITGPQAWSGDDIARIASAVTGRPVSYRPLQMDAALAGPRAAGESAYMQRHLSEVWTLMTQGAAAATTDVVPAICHRPAGAVEPWLRRALAPAQS